MIKCRYCGTELPDDAVYCDNCGKRVIKEPVREAEPMKSGQITADNADNNKGKTKPFKLIILAAVLLTVILIQAVRINDSYEWEDPFEDLPKITIEQYDSIEVGMTYDEITEAFDSYGDEFVEGVYRWPGELYDEVYTYCEFEFNDDKVLTKKTEYNMYDGSKVVEGWDNVAPVIKPETAELIRRGMSLAEVEELFGGSGTMQSSTSDSTGMVLRTYRWNIFDSDEDPTADPETDYDWYYDEYITVDFDENDTVDYWEVWD